MLVCSRVRQLENAKQSAVKNGDVASSTREELVGTKLRIDTLTSQLIHFQKQVEKRPCLPHSGPVLLLRSVCVPLLHKHVFLCVSVHVRLCFVSVSLCLCFVPVPVCVCVERGP